MNEVLMSTPGDHYNWPMLKIRYLTSEAAVAAVLPPGFEPGKRPSGHGFFAHLGASSSCSSFKTFFAILVEILMGFSIVGDAVSEAIESSISSWPTRPADGARQPPRRFVQAPTAWARRGGLSFRLGP